MAYEGYFEYDGVELANIARTVALASAMGIDVVWTRPETVSWIAVNLGQTGYNDITKAPWYRTDVPESANFAGIVPLGMQGIDDSSLEAAISENIGDSAQAAKPRTGSMPIVANFALVGLNEAAVEYGKRWLEFVLRGSGDRTFCVGANLRYFRSPGVNMPRVHRRNVATTRSVSITRKTKRRQSTTWVLTFTLTDTDGYVYSEPIDTLERLGGAGRPNELVKNPDFEAGNTTGWQALTGATLSVDTTEFHSGTRSMKVVTTSASGAVTAVAAGNEGTWSSGLLGQETSRLWVKAAVGVTFRTRTQEFTNPGAVAVTPAPAFQNTPATGAWQQLTFPAYKINANSINRVEILTTGAATFWVDDVSLTNAALPLPSSSGSLELVQESCPIYDYSPLFDPLYPAMVSSPTAPNLLPEGWNIDVGMAFTRYWAKPSRVPSQLPVVPIVTLTASSEARRIRFSVWPASSPTNDQCDPLWSVIVTYLPAGLSFIIDGEQKAAYVWDGVSPSVRRSDSLVFAPDAKPVRWDSFPDTPGLMYTLDVFKVGGVPEGGGTVRASLDLVSKDG